MNRASAHTVPSGVLTTIEYIVKQLGYDQDDIRKGDTIWILKHNSATLNISYHEYSGFIIGDVYLCRLPDDKHKLSDLYGYMLMQNESLQGLTLSIKDEFIILSILIYDQSMHADTMQKMFRRLLDTADDMDNLLVEQYGANW